MRIHTFSLQGVCFRFPKVRWAGRFERRARQSG